MKNSKIKIFVAVASILFIFVVSSLSMVYATSYVFGSTSAHGSLKLTPGVANVACSLKLKPLSETDSSFNLETFYTYLELGSGTAKGVVWNATSKAVLAISTNTQEGSGGWKSFNFDYILLNNTDYYFGVICNTGYWVYYDAASSQTQYGGQVNSYASPTNLDDGANGFMSGYIVISSYSQPEPVYSIDVYWDSDFTSANLMSVNPSITALSKSENSIYDIHTYVRLAGALYGSGSYTLQTTELSLVQSVVTTGTYETRQAVPSGSGHYLYDLPAVTNTGGVRYQGLRVSIEFSPTNTTTKTFLLSFSGSGVFVTPSPPDGGSTTGGSYGFLDNDLVLFILALLFIFVPPMLVVISVPKVGMAGFMLVLTGCAALGVVYLGLPFYFLVFAAIGICVMFYSMLQRS